MNYTVHLVIDAENDLLDIYRYVTRHDSAEKAGRLMDNLEKTITKLETLPLRGHHPPELERIGVLEFREIFFRPYRIIYQISNKDVYVHSEEETFRNYCSNKCCGEAAIRHIRKYCKLLPDRVDLTW